MSWKTVSSFAEAACSDPGLSVEIDRAVSVDEVVALGRRHGYEFSADDVLAFTQRGVVGSELSEEELEVVAAAAFFPGPGTPQCDTALDCITEADTCGTQCGTSEPFRLVGP